MTGATAWRWPASFILALVGPTGRPLLDPLLGTLRAPLAIKLVVLGTCRTVSLGHLGALRHFIFIIFIFVIFILLFLLKHSLFSTSLAPRRAGAGGRGRPPGPVPAGQRERSETSALQAAPSRRLLL